MRRADAALLALLGVALAAPAPGFVERWMALPHGDMAQHLVNALAVGAEFRLGNPLRPLLFWTDAAAYPPVGYVVPAALGVHGVLELCAFQVAWILLACVGTYALGRSLWNRGTGLVAALLVGFAPTVLMYVRTFLLDLPSMATVVCALALIALSERFTRRGWSLAAGAMIGLALLTKWTALFFLAPPLAVLAWPARRWVAGLLALLLAAMAAQPFGAGELWIPLGAGGLWLAGFVAVALAFARGPLVVQALALATTIAGPFYVWNTPMLLSRVAAERAQGVAMTFGEGLAGLTQASAFFPTAGMVVLAGLIVVGVRGPRERVLYVAAPLLCGCAALFLLNLGWARYLLPAVPLMALAAVGWLPWWALVAAGLWNAGVWVSGNYVPEDLDVVMAPVPGCAPGSLNAWTRDLMSRVPEGVVQVDLQTPLLKPEMMQVWALDADRAVVVKGAHAPAQGALRRAALSWDSPPAESRLRVGPSLDSWLY